MKECGRPPTHRGAESATDISTQLGSGGVNSVWHTLTEQSPLSMLICPWAHSSACDQGGLRHRAPQGAGMWEPLCSALGPLLPAPRTSSDPWGGSLAPCPSFRAWGHRGPSTALQLPCPAIPERHTQNHQAVLGSWRRAASFFQTKPSVRLGCRNSTTGLAQYDPGAPAGVGGVDNSRTL